MKHINPQYNQVLAKMKQRNGLTKAEMGVIVNISKFNNYCIEMYGDKPRHQKDGKYRITFTQEDREYQCLFLGRIYKGIESQVTKQAEHIALTTTDPYVLELSKSLGITTANRHFGIAQ